MEKKKPFLITEEQAKLWLQMEKEGKVRDRDDIIACFPRGRKKKNEETEKDRTENSL